MIGGSQVFEAVVDYADDDKGMKGMKECFNVFQMNLIVLKPMNGILGTPELAAETLASCCFLRGPTSTPTGNLAIFDGMLARVSSLAWLSALPAVAGHVVGRHVETSPF